MPHLLVSLLLAAVLAPSLVAQARLVVEPPKLHLGTVYYGNSVDGTVELVNVGDELLVIDDVKSSCGCTAASLPASRKTIAPGGRVTLPITMTPKSATTPLRKSVNIVSNDPSARVTPIEVSCDVLEGVVPEPGFILFQGVDVGDMPSREMTLTSKNGVPFEITNITFTTPLYRATWDRSARPALRHSVRVTAGPIDERIVPSALMQVLTTHPQTPRLRIHANTNVLPLIDLDPDRLAFPPTAPGGSSSVRVRLYDRDADGPVRVLSTSLQSDPAYDVTATQDRDDPLVWTFTVTVPADETRPRLSTTASLMTNRQTLMIPSVVPIVR